jgi:hypothetical protein
MPGLVPGSHDFYLFGDGAGNKPGQGLAVKAWK